MPKGRPVRGPSEYRGKLKPFIYAAIEEISNRIIYDNLNDETKKILIELLEVIKEIKKICDGRGYY